jgi:hypothetical protein
MTPAERQRRRRAKLAAIVDPQQVLADLHRLYQRAFPADQDVIRAGLKKLLTRWQKDADHNKRLWRRRVMKRSRR